LSAASGGRSFGESDDSKNVENVEELHVDTATTQKREYERNRKRAYRARKQFFESGEGRV
jgi:hypothetical protein